MADCRRFSAEHSISPGSEPVDDDTNRCIDALSREPDPVHAAMLAETLARLLDGLDDRDRKIVTLALEGATSAEISSEVERSERTGAARRRGRGSVPQ